MTNESLANLPSAEYVSAEQSSIPNISEPVPSLMLSNTMSLAPKIDEVCHSVLQTDVDLACFTETWLTDFVHDNDIQIPGYNVVRRDRLIGQHGGVCLYVKESIPFEILSQYHNDQFEVLWVKARPHKLPRGLSCIIIGSIYHPPSANDRNMIDFLTEQLSLIESTYYNCGLILLGDFNNLNCHRLNNHFSLKQLVKFPTRGRRTLDLILTNLAKFYLPPVKLPPFGLSDHFTILSTPKHKVAGRTKYDISEVRNQHPRNKAAISTFITEFDWSILDSLSSCDEKWSAFESIIRFGMDILLPTKNYKETAR